MPTITFTLSDAASTELVDAICASHFYSPVDGNGQPNPETRVQFARRMVRQWLIAQVKQYRREQAAIGSNPTDPDIA